MKHPISIPLFLKLGFLISACLVSHAGYTSFEDEESPYRLEPALRHNDLLNTAWENEREPKSKAVLTSKNQPARNASILFSIDHVDTPTVFIADEETAPSHPLQQRPAEPLPEVKDLNPFPAAAPQNAPAPAVLQQSASTNKQEPIQPPQDAPKTILAQNEAAQTNATGAQEPPKKVLINFNNVGIIEYIRFISRISNKNFVFDEADLQFNVTIISEEPTSIENIMTALIQELRIHDLTLIEQGNNLIIHKNPKVNSVSRVVADDLPGSNDTNAELVTQVFRLNTLDPAKAAGVIRPLISERALVESLRDTNHLIVTDVVSNVNQISELLKSLDAPNSGLVIGQYVARTADIDTLLPLVQQIMQPISQDQPLSFVPYSNSNSIFIISTPFLVERSISILQHLDQEKGTTRIIDLRELKFEGKGAGKGGGAEAAKPVQPARKPGAIRSREEPGWEYGPSEKELEEKREREREKEREQARERERERIFQQAAEAAARAPSGVNILPLFIPVEMPAPPAPKCPTGEHKKEHEEEAPLRPPPLQVGVTEFPEIEEDTGVAKLLRPVQLNETVPLPVARSKFYIHKLQYRSGDLVLGQVQQVGSSLQNTTNNAEFLATINTAQWLQGAKAIVVTGTPENIDKVRELIEQLDTPLRQVYIEMLILQTTVDDSLNYGVDWGVRFGGGNQAGSIGFSENASVLQGSLDSAGVTDLGGQVPNFPAGVTPTTPFNNVLIPDPRNLAKTVGFNLGVMGQHIIHKGLGLEFNTIGALVQAVHDFASTNVVMCPQFLTGDGIPAQIFVGINTPYKTQSVANDLGSIITNNFIYLDVGTSVQVTPHITNGDIVAMDIVEENSSLATTTLTNINSASASGPTTNKTSTRTSVMVPDGYFVIMSGMMQDEVDEARSQIPCLGSIPVLGGLFSNTSPVTHKRNLMFFIRPQIIDTDEEIQNITRHQQDIWKAKNVLKPKWLVETETALDYLNIRSTMNTDDLDDLPCREFVH